MFENFCAKHTKPFTNPPIPNTTCERVKGGLETLAEGAEAGGLAAAGASAPSGVCPRV